MPTSITVAPGLIQSPGTISGRPTAATTISARRTTSGKSIEGVEVKCVDVDGNEVASGEQGVILVKGFNVMQGYLV